MAYPMVALVRWARFRADLEENHGVEVIALDDGVPGCYLKNGDRVMSVPILLDDDEHVTPSTITNICYHLGLDAKKFGLALD